jgi:hypothetical protein
MRLKIGYSPMNTLLIYFILNGLGRWDFLMVEPTPAPGYCAALRHDVANVYEARRGNFRIVCADDKRVES